MSIELFTKIAVFQIILSFVIVSISIKIGFLDVPSERKIHAEPVPYSGGIIISIVHIFIIYLIDFESKFLHQILSYSFLICLCGLIDDRFKVNPGTKIILQIIPIIFLVEQDLYLRDLGNYFFLGQIDLGFFAKIFTILCILLLINAFNYCDGIDGLLSSVHITILLSFSLYLYLLGENFNYFICTSFPLVLFLFFNFGVFKKFKIFLGDSGSNLLGFICGFNAIYLYEVKNIHPSLIIWPLCYVVYEFLSVNIIRIFYNREIFKAGNDHLHYEIKEFFALKSQNISLIIIIAINIFFSIIGIYLHYFIKPDFSILLFITLFFVYLTLRFNFHKKLINK